MEKKLNKLHKQWNFISWEPELFISVGLILFLLEGKELFNAINIILTPYNIAGTALILTIISGMTGGLIIGFAIHIILRAYWLMCAGFYQLKNNNSEELNQESDNIATLKMAKSTDLAASYAGLAFSITMFLLIASIGASFGLIVLHLISAILGVTFVINLILFFILLINFTTLGVLNRGFLGKLLQPFFKLMNLLTLSFLYRNIYYYLQQKLKRKHFIYIITIFVLTSLFHAARMFVLIDNVSVQAQYFKKEHLRSFYKDEADAYSGSYANISSYHQDQNYIRLFLAKRGDLIGDLDNVEKLSFLINGKVIEPYAIRQFEGSQNERGIVCFINISDLKNNQEYELKTMLDGENYVVIPFFKGD